MRLQLLDDRRGGGPSGPHRLQHLLSRAVWDDQDVVDIAATWAASHLDDADAVLIVDETADEKSSADAAGAARAHGRSSRTCGPAARPSEPVGTVYPPGRKRGIGRYWEIVAAGSPWATKADQ